MAAVAYYVTPYEVVTRLWVIDPRVSPASTERRVIERTQEVGSLVPLPQGCQGLFSTKR